MYVLTSTSTSTDETAVMAVPRILSPLSMELHFGSYRSVLYDFPAVHMCFAQGISTAFVTGWSIHTLFNDDISSAENYVV